VSDGAVIVDTRDKFAFAGGHLPGSLNIQDNSAFTTWAGWMLNYEDPFILIATVDRIEELTRGLIRIGLDNIVGYLPNLEAWSNLGHECEIVNQVTAESLKEELTHNEIQVIDVRNQSEFDEGHIPGAIKIQAGQLEENLHLIPKDKSIVLNCLSGDRSSIAASYLLANGFTKVKNLTGGIKSWIEAGYTVESRQQVHALSA
jgi:hydroxyacylglutathione hydrolase